MMRTACGPSCAAGVAANDAAIAARNFACRPSVMAAAGAAPTGRVQRCQQGS
jgi:hypothetical protein